MPPPVPSSIVPAKTFGAACHIDRQRRVRGAPPLLNDRAAGRSASELRPEIVTLLPFTRSVPFELGPKVTALGAAVFRRGVIQLNDADAWIVRPPLNELAALAPSVPLPDFVRPLAPDDGRRNSASFPRRRRSGLCGRHVQRHR